jgi:hypothetical protein
MNRNQHKKLGLVAILLADTACSPEYSKKSDLFPTKTYGPQPDPGRKDPWESLDEFEQWYRVGVASEPLCNYEPEGYEGPSALIYPTSIRLGAPWKYVLIGEDFRAQKNLGGAARAYWSALTLVGTRTIASRPEKERIRLKAYEGLEAIAKARGQYQWATLHWLCSHLADSYLGTDQSRADEDTFYAQMDRARKAQISTEEAREALEHQAMMNALAAGLGQLNVANAQLSGNTSQALSLQIGNIGNAVEMGARQEAGYQALAAAVEQNSNAFASFKTMVADEVTDIQAGNSFAGREVTFYLAAARDSKPYLKVLRDYAKMTGNTSLQAVVESFAGAPTPAGILKIAEEVKRREIWAALHERRQKE